MTVGEVIDSGKRVHGECRSCGRERDVDLTKLNVKRDLPLSALGYRLRCTDCKERQIVLTVVGEDERATA